MKTIKSSLFLSLMTILALLTFSGCYTQLALVDDDPVSTVTDQSPIIIVIDYPRPYDPIPPYDPGPPPTTGPYNPLPPAGSSSPVVEKPSTHPVRDYGSQRSNSSGETQPTSSNTGTRTSGSTRGGR